MCYKNFSKRELSEILGIIQETLKCKSESDIVSLTGKIKELVYADMSVCALGETATGSLLKVVNHNWPDEWAGIYTSEQLCKRDPVFLFNISHQQAYTWSEAMRNFPGKPGEDVMNKASEFRLKYGLSSGISSDGPKGSIFSFAGDRDRFTSHHLMILDILTPHLHQALVRICGSRFKADAPLSHREREVLKWVREGKTNWEISVILSISERTVKFHIQNIERKLNAVNKAHAIAIALDSGLLA
ncbi:MAG: LuxR C-terminal-related transcriptional regulator [Thermodesulfobacteriota bacterium]|nr:MAG: LuxR C-terminal-related transcriptional regulator [Thermodesulfobacteriota bacterium]